MTEKPIYYASELEADMCFEIAMFLFATRRNSGLSITETAVRSGLAVNDVDELETQAERYDFAKITKLLDLYKKKLPISASCFKKMPLKLAEKYFEN